MSEKIIIKMAGGNILVVVDGQNDFILNIGALRVKGVPGESANGTIIRRINSLARKPFDLLVTTEDCHPQDHVEFTIFGSHCVEGRFGQNYHERLRNVYDRANCRLFKGQHKQIISYSVATSPNFPDHITRLRTIGFKRVFLTGWAYTHCVGESAIAYACQGFKTYVIRDCTRSVPLPYGNPEMMDKKLELYGVKQVFFRDIH